MTNANNDEPAVVHNSYELCMEVLKQVYTLMKNGSKTYNTKIDNDSVVIANHYGMDVIVITSNTVSIRDPIKEGTVKHYLSELGFEEKIFDSMNFMSEFKYVKLNSEINSDAADDVLPHESTFYINGLIEIALDNFKKNFQ